MSQNTPEKCKQEMEKKLQALDKELIKIRTGRSSISMLDSVRVDYYGVPTPLNQVANLSTPDAKSIVVSPFEKKLIGDIEKAIQKASLGLQPTNDGNIVRVPVPQLTEERRKDLVKSIKKLGEDAKVGIRNVRRDLNESVKRSEKSKEVSEDQSHRLQQDIQKHTDQYVKIVDEKITKKEKEVMTL